MYEFPTQIMPSSYYATLKNNDIFRYFWRSFIKIWMMTFKYTDTPKTFRQFNFCKGILYNGSAMIFKEENTKEWYSLPYILGDEGITRVYGEPKNPVGVGVASALLKPYNDEWVIVYDNITKDPPIYSVYTAALNCYKIYVTYEYNLAHQRKPGLIAGTRNEQKSINAMINDIENNEIYIKVSPKFDIDKTFKVLDLKVPYIGSSLLTDLNTVQNWFLEEIGCVTGVAKAERMNENEVFANERKARINLAGRLMSRREALDDLKSRTDFTGEVEVNDLDFEELAFTQQDVDNLNRMDGEQNG